FCRLDENVGRALVRTEPPRNLEHPPARRIVSGLERHEARVRFERSRIVGEPLVAQLGDAAKKLAPFRRIHLEFEMNFEHANEIPHLIALLVDTLENDGRSRTKGRHFEASL